MPPRRISVDEAFYSPSPSPTPLHSVARSATPDEPQKVSPMPERRDPLADRCVSVAAMPVLLQELPKSGGSSAATTRARSAHRGGNQPGFPKNRSHVKLDRSVPLSPEFRASTAALLDRKNMDEEDEYPRGKSGRRFCSVPLVVVVLALFAALYAVSVGVSLGLSEMRYRPAIQQVRRGRVFSAARLAGDAFTAPFSRRSASLVLAAADLAARREPIPTGDLLSLAPAEVERFLSYAMHLLGKDAGFVALASKGSGALLGLVRAPRGGGDLRALLPGELVGLGPGSTGNAAYFTGNASLGELSTNFSATGYPAARLRFAENIAASTGANINATWLTSDVQRGSASVTYGFPMPGLEAEPFAVCCLDVGDNCLLSGLWLTPPGDMLRGLHADLVWRESGTLFAVDVTRGLMSTSAKRYNTLVQASTVGPDKRVFLESGNSAEIGTSLEPQSAADPSQDSLEYRALERLASDSSEFDVQPSLVSAGAATATATVSSSGASSSGQGSRDVPLAAVMHLGRTRSLAGGDFAIGALNYTDTLPGLKLLVVSAIRASVLDETDTVGFQALSGLISVGGLSGALVGVAMLYIVAAIAASVAVQRMLSGAHELLVRLEKLDFVALGATEDAKGSKDGAETRSVGGRDGQKKGRAGAGDEHLAEAGRSERWKAEAARAKQEQKQKEKAGTEEVQRRAGGSGGEDEARAEDGRVLRKLDMDESEYYYSTEEEDQVDAGRNGAAEDRVPPPHGIRHRKWFVREAGDLQTQINAVAALYSVAGPYMPVALLKTLRDVHDQRERDLASQADQESVPQTEPEQTRIVRIEDPASIPRPALVQSSAAGSSSSASAGNTVSPPEAGAAAGAAANPDAYPASANASVPPSPAALQRAAATASPVTRVQADGTKTLAVPGAALGNSGHTPAARVTMSASAPVLGPGGDASATGSPGAAGKSIMKPLAAWGQGPAHQSNAGAAARAAREHSVAVNPLALGVLQVDVVLVHIDIAGVADATRRLPPRDFALLLGGYRDAITEVILSEGGIPANVSGGAATAVFGYPSRPWSPGEAAKAACRCAVRSLALLEAKKLEWSLLRWAHSFVVGLEHTCAVAAGTVLAGNTGTSLSRSFDLLGSVSRFVTLLASFNGNYSTSLLVTGEVAAAAGPDFAFLWVDTLRVDGSFSAQGSALQKQQQKQQEQLQRQFQQQRLDHEDLHQLQQHHEQFVSMTLTKNNAANGSAGQTLVHVYELATFRGSSSYALREILPVLTRARDALDRDRPDDVAMYLVEAQQALPDRARSWQPLLNRIIAHKRGQGSLYLNLRRA